VGSRSKARARAQASQPAAQRTSAPRQPRVPPVPQPPASAQSLAVAQPPRAVLVAAVVQAIEAAGVLVAAVLAAVATAHGDSYLKTSGVAITVIAIGLAVALGFVARGLRACRRWSRTPALLTQLFTGIAAVTLLQGAKLEWGIPAIALAVTGLGALLAPASLRQLTPGRVEKS
jgi:hypothetical protein